MAHDVGNETFCYGCLKGVCYWVNQSYKLPATFQYFLGKILTNSKKPTNMITYSEIAVIRNEALGDVEVFLNADDDIAFENQSAQFLFTITKDDWEDIKGFIDNQFESIEPTPDTTPDTTPSPNNENNI
jgi:hypothetical protein